MRIFMLKKLRLYLTLICVLATGAIVRTVSLSLLNLFEKRLYKSVYSALDEKVSSLTYRMRNDALMDWDWLAQTEAAETLIVPIETHHIPLKFPGTYKTQTIFTASASHELRSPLTVIRASAETLQYKVTERGKPFAKAIESKCTLLLWNPRLLF